jgi:hypothetical protein
MALRTLVAPCRNLLCWSSLSVGKSAAMATLRGFQNSLGPSLGVWKKSRTLIKKASFAGVLGSFSLA